MTTNTLVRSTEVVLQGDTVVITRALSKDMLISYINFMRQFMNLAPMSIDSSLSEEAERRAKFLSEHNHIHVDPDRSVFSVSKAGTMSWIHGNRLPIRSPFRIMIPPFDSDDYLSFILNEQYSTIGICVCPVLDTPSEKYMVQIFGTKELPPSSTF
jgi:uncharacterized protein YkwD